MVRLACLDRHGSPPLTIERSVHVLRIGYDLVPRGEAIWLIAAGIVGALAARRSDSLSAAVGQLGPQNASVSGEAGRHQRSRYRRVESRRESKGESAIDDDVLGPAAVGIDANDFLNQAELFSALLAESTREASLLLVADAHAITRRRCITAEPASSPTPTNTHDLIAGDEWKSRVTQSLSMNWRSPRATLQCIIITGTSCLPSARS